MTYQFQPQVFVADYAILQSDKGFDHFAGRWIGLADHCRLGDRRMIGQRALHLEWADQVSRRLDHIVFAADEPEVPVGVSLREISGQVEAVHEALPVALIGV